MSRLLVLTAGLALAVLPIVWTGPHPLVASLAVLGAAGTMWIARHRLSTLRGPIALALVAQVGAAHRLADPPTWWPIAAALLLFVFVDAVSTAAEEKEQDPGAASPLPRRALVLGATVVLVAMGLESVVLADLGSGLLPTIAAVAAVTSLILGVGHLVRTRP
ncbi:MAG: hypothetical protein HKN46_08055 [Acidimicrobiia bacterium]|nr:hypothetical protein [Acidimicrobiia bacterium]